VSARRVLQEWVFRSTTERQTHKVHFLTVPSLAGCCIQIRSDQFMQFSSCGRARNRESKRRGQARREGRGGAARLGMPRLGTAPRRAGRRRSSVRACACPYVSESSGRRAGVSVAVCRSSRKAAREERERGGMVALQQRRRQNCGGLFVILGGLARGFCPVRDQIRVRYLGGAPHVLPTFITLVNKPTGCHRKSSLMPLLTV
jgi:hypothetical protein